MYSAKRLRLETTPENLFGRITDLLCPIGIGQCGVIAGPKQTGKMLVLENIASAVGINHPDVVIFVLLIDMDQEETEMLRNALKSSLVLSVNAETRPSPYVHPAGFVLKWAQKLAEFKRDVLVFLVLPDSQCRNVSVMDHQKNQVTVSPCEVVKQFVQLTRNPESAGSLTMIAVTGDWNSHCTDCGIKQLQESCDIRILMDRKVLQEGIFPAVNVLLSRNRKEKELFSNEDMARIFVLRKVLEPLSAAEAVKLLGSKLLVTKTNGHFLANMSSI
jgi:transcription termination factor Rho